ncbi:MAG TPA: RNA polymerase sigma factor [Acidimicrobiales bacterium]|nr:RNA polymerase sigma factor [Acidimicrobiales bacterium]
MSDDAAWLRAAATGDHAAVRRLLDEAGPVLYGYVFARVGGDDEAAADIVQDTFLEAMRGASSFRGDSAVTTWLCSIASRRLARHYEAERRQAEARRGLAAVPEPPESTGFDVITERDAVVRALGRLSVPHRQVLVMKYLDGRAVAEIAADLGRTRVQVQSLLQRARDALRVELEVAT